MSKLWLMCFWVAILFAILPQFAFSADPTPIPDFQLIWPAGGGVGQDYAEFNDVSERKYHTGLDIFVSPGTDVLAVYSGNVVSQTSLADPGVNNKTNCMGNVIVIDHTNGFFSLYAHLNCNKEPLQPAEGEEFSFVNQGEKIGESGSSTGDRAAGEDCDPDGVFGNHLHLEIKEHEGLNAAPGSTEWGYTAITLSNPVAERFCHQVKVLESPEYSGRFTCINCV